MALVGSLQDMALTDLFQIFATSSKTGVLRLVCGSQHGVIYFAKGTLCDAILVRREDRKIVAAGEAAVIDMLQWSDGQFTFWHDLRSLERPVKIIHNASWLIQESIRQRSKPLQAPAYQPVTVESQLELVTLPEDARRRVELTVDQWRVLSKIVTSQHIRDVITQTDMSETQVIQNVTELIALGLVAVKVPTRSQLQRAVSQELPATRSMPVDLVAVTNGSHQSSSTYSLLAAIRRRIRQL
ncbi:MAG: hypothetical protein GFH27_549281n88 [Chloroflexi bacterium AL-W]|nr:hypothetical protein [Chloroflexi bacterium AL-N1]NOK65974.1 hypothetical protein [Chloroflexi bacterium AL-N10]NOK72855.1 hypothetical protein [Chloroflexi bacterium AL-N5]NOK79752.1 hypothetical protein [Chloroflexi bacterium AL-W]NOK88392.1 hypothetical protein [Chloroflexi bacterium AL-N15]